MARWLFCTPITLRFPGAEIAP
jgi:ATP-dependent DNA ligase